MTKEPQQKKPKPSVVKSFTEAAEAMGVKKPAETGPPAGPTPKSPTAPSSQTQRDRRPVPHGQGGGQNSPGENIGLPLRPAIRTAVQAQDRWSRCHPGLAFAKFPDTWEPHYKDPKTRTALFSSFHTEGPKKKGLLSRICGWVPARVRNLAKIT
jgi:hypothetical protein